MARAAEALATVTPPGMDRVHFTLSGAEAVETGLKLARAHGKRRLVLMHHGYHGKTLGALSVTAKEVYQQPFQPLLPDVTHVPFGQTEALERELVAHPGAVCVIVEPVQGEGGVIIPPPGYLTGVADLCRRHDGFLILDEVQSGLGRLGHWWECRPRRCGAGRAADRQALGGGVLPVSAAVANQQIFAPFDKDPYVHTATFSGAPVLMAAVRGAIQAIKEDRLITKAAELDARLLPEIERIARENCGDLVVNVRGKGLLIGVELVDFSSRVPVEPAELLGGRVIRRMDRFVQFAVVAAWEAVADAGLDSAAWDSARIAVVLGRADGGPATVEQQHRVLLEEAPTRVSPLQLPNMSAGQVSIDLGVTGPSLVMATACASGATAIGLARDLLTLDRCDVVLAGGSEAMITPLVMAGFAQMGALSRRVGDPPSASQPFDQARDGFMAGEGAAVLILERPADARARVPECAGWWCASARAPKHTTSPRRIRPAGGASRHCERRWPTLRSDPTRSTT